MNNMVKRLLSKLKDKTTQPYNVVGFTIQRVKCTGYLFNFSNVHGVPMLRYCSVLGELSYIKGKVHDVPDGG